MSANDAHTNCGCPHGFPCGAVGPNYCTLCGEWLGRQMGKGSHYDCRKQLEYAVQTLVENLVWAGALRLAAVRGPIPQHPSAHEPHEYSEAFNGYDCAICGEGFCYYLHTDRPEYEP